MASFTFALIVSLLWLGACATTETPPDHSSVTSLLDSMLPIVSTRADEILEVGFTGESEADNDSTETSTTSNSASIRHPVTGTDFAATLEARLMYLFANPIRVVPDRGDHILTISDEDRALDERRRDEFAATLRRIAEIEVKLSKFDSDAPREMRPFLGPYTPSMQAIPMGLIRLTKHLGPTGSGNAYIGECADGQWVVVKYSQDCKTRRLDNATEHPMFVDALFLNALNPTGLVVRPIYLSAPSALSGERPINPRLITKSLDRSFEECVAVGTQVRLMVTELAGVSLSEYLFWLRESVDWSTNARRTVSLVIPVVQMLEVIHDKGVLHGDIHRSNILFKSPIWDPSKIDPNDTSLVFVDFEYAVFFPSEINTETRTEPGHRNPVLLSHWQLANWRMGRRDDIYRALEILADSLNLRIYWEHLQAVLSSGLENAPVNVIRSYLTRMKEPMELFRGALSHMQPGPNRNAAGGLIKEMVARHIQSLNHPDERPDYHALVTVLEQLRDLF